MPETDATPRPGMTRNGAKMFGPLPGRAMAQPYRLDTTVISLVCNCREENLLSHLEKKNTNGSFKFV